MKLTFIHSMRAIIALALVMSMFIAAIPHDVEAVVPENYDTSTETVNLVVLDAPMSNYNEVNKHFWKSTYLTAAPNNVSRNYSVSYDSTYDAAKIGSKRNATGHIAFGGFVPAVTTTLSFDLMVPTNSQNNYGFVLYWYGMSISFTTVWNNSYKCSIIHYTPTTVTNTYYSAPITTATWMHWNLTWNGDSVYEYSIKTDNGKVNFHGYNQTYQNYNFDSPPTMMPTNFYLQIAHSTSGAFETYYYIYFKNLTQTVPITKSAAYASSPAQKYSALGFDYPVQYSYVNFTKILPQYDASCTVFFDPGYYNNPAYYNASNVAAMMGAGFEVGLHTASLATYNAAGRLSADAHIGAVFNQTYQYWGNKSIVWTSWGNDYDWQYNDYMWDNYNAIGRKYWAHWSINMGGMNEITDQDAARGNSWIRYIHYLADGAGGTSSDMTNEELIDLIETSQENGLNIVGYLEYWSRYAAYEMASVTVGEINSYSAKVSYEYDWLELNTPIELTANLSMLGFGINETPASNIVVRDANGDVVPSTYANGIITWDALEGVEYSIYSVTAHRSYMMDEAISPIFAIIPLVIILSVIPLVMGLGRKLK